VKTVEALVRWPQNDILSLAMFSFHFMKQQKVRVEPDSTQQLHQYTFARFQTKALKCWTCDHVTSQKLLLISIKLPAGHSMLA